ncbi:MAG: glycosyltransferase family 4 protein [Candidatus Zhuqueibacterota bacterium]
MWYYLFGYIFILTFAVSYALVPAIRTMAEKLAVLDHPGERKIHTTPKPRMGGLAFVSSFVLVIMLHIAGLYVFRDSDLIAQHFPMVVRVMDRLSSVLPKLMVILIGGVLMTVIGLLDDYFREQFSYRFKFLAQFAVAALVVSFGIRTEFLPGAILDILVSVIWIVGMSNSFNLLDNMDGLAAGISVISALLFFIISIVQQQVFMAFIFCAFAGSVSGFLPYNFKPAKIFMGDTGSLFIGFLFGALTLQSSYRVPGSHSLITVILPVIILSIPIYDTLSVILIRMRERRSIFIGDKCHFSHRLVNLGFSEKWAVLFIYLISLCIGIGSLLLPYTPLWGNILILMQAISIYILITALMVVGRNNHC